MPNLASHAVSVYPDRLAMLRHSRRQSLRQSLRQLALSAALLTMAATASDAQTDKTPTVPVGRVTFLDYATTVPTGWTNKTPSSSMRLAEYTTAAAGGSNGADVIVYFFGKGQGGSPDANLARWKGQFSNPTGGPVQESVTHDAIGDIKLTIAEYRGTYARAVGMGSSQADALPNHILIAVVAETPRGTLFFQCFGPVTAVEAQRAAYLKFVKGLR